MHKADQHTTSRSTEESMEYAYLGIDIAKRKYDVALRLPDARVRVKAFANDAAGHAALRAWITRVHADPVHACLEATGTYGDGLAETLADAGLVVSVVNPAIIKAYARSCLTRTKTDPTDARLMAQFCATQQPRPWVPRPPEVRALQALVRRLDALEGMRTQERNRLAADPPAEVHDSITHVIALLEAEMQARSNAHPRACGSAPAPAPATRPPDVDSGHRRRHRRGAARRIRAAGPLPPGPCGGGLCRRRATRGSLRHLPAPSPAPVEARRPGDSQGPVPSGAAPPCAATRSRSGLQARLLADGKHRMLIVGAVMRKLVHLAFGVLKTGQPFRPDFAQTR